MPKLTPADKMRKALASMKAKAMKMYDDIESLELLVNNMPAPVVIEQPSIKAKRGRPSKTK